MLRGLAFIARPEHLKRVDPDTPILFISGAMDPVGGCSNGVQKAFRSFRKAGVRDVSIRLYPDLRHEILNEDCRQTVYQDLFQWMSAHSSQQEGASV